MILNVISDEDLKILHEARKLLAANHCYMTPHDREELFTLMRVSLNRVHKVEASDAKEVREVRKRKS